MIRKARIDDQNQIIKVLQTIQDAGDSYFFQDMSPEELLDYWNKPKFECFIFEEAGKVLGSYILGPIADGRSSHIANASYTISHS